MGNRRVAKKIDRRRSVRQGGRKHRYRRKNLEKAYSKNRQGMNGVDSGNPVATPAQSKGFPPPSPVSPPPPVPPCGSHAIDKSDSCVCHHFPMICRLQGQAIALLAEDVGVAIMHPELIGDHRGPVHDLNVKVSHLLYVTLRYRGLFLFLRAIINHTVHLHWQRSPC